VNESEALSDGEGIALVKGTQDKDLIMCTTMIAGL
jgi:hypothetical protein